ncbi:integrin alpha [Flindersiella endophytica]
MRKQIISLAVVAGLAVAGAAAAPPLASPAAAATCTGGQKAFPDFDGSGGDRPDVAVGIPGEDLGTEADAGMVEIRYAGDSPAPQGIHGPGYHAGDRFGTSIAASDVNQDGCTDLLVGTPGRDVGGLADAGSVEVYLGSPTGVRWSKTITLEGRGQAGAQFGSVLSVYNDGQGPFLAGLPLYDVSGAKDAGALVEFGIEGLLGGPYTQNEDSISGAAEAGDHFGAQVVAVFYEGDDRGFETSAPLEDGGGAVDAGVAFECRGSTTAAPDCTGVSQDSPGVPGSVEPGDRFGAALAYRYIGVPGEDIGSIQDAGMVVSYDMQGISQDTPGVPGAPEAGDQFGASLAVFTPVQPELSTQTLHVGVPGEDIGSATNAGMVVTVHQPLDPVDTPTGLSALSADTTAGTVGAGDRYGAALGSYRILDGDQWSELLLIGSPGDRSGAGEAIAVETGDNGAGLLGSQAWSQFSGAPEPGDGYGSEVSSLS